MDEQTTSPKKHHKGWIPEEAREHARTARQEMKKGLESLVPPEFMRHRRQARREMLLAWRSVIDAYLKRLED